MLLRTILTFTVLLHLLIETVETTSPSQFIDDIKGYRSACKSIGWEPKKDCTAYDVVAFHANLKSHLTNTPMNTTVKIEMFS